MSRPSRVARPSRSETRARVLAAAIEVFVERGIAGAAIDDIADAAGFSRGAVYSNFADKDELVLALLQQVTDDSVQELEELLAKYPNPNDNIRALQELMQAPTRRNGRYHPVLSIELVLYAMRNAKARPLLRERLVKTEAAILRVVEHNATALGLLPADNRAAISAMIVAMDDGFSLHALIDPTRDPVEALSVALDFLGEAGAAIALAERAGEKRAPTRPSVRRAGRVADAGN
jgi:AcrR family transcriptional regulator